MHEVLTSSGGLPNADGAVERRPMDQPSPQFCKP